MSLKKLIDKQTIIIDDHKRGNGEVKNWDNPSIDIHIDKKTNYRLNGKQQEVRIRLPINSDRPLRIEGKGRKQLNDVPGQLRREIQQAFENKDTRESFVTDVVETLKNYDTILNSEQRVEQVLKNLSRHFNLQWTDEKIATYRNEVLELYTRNYTDQTGRQFFITVDNKKIKIGENNGYARHQKSLK
ncbi:MAG: hypothetical protein IPO83_17920 [Chitinophagaceae bacterium]|nr:hypothetical protein [Chitinophagaceae bacterium]